MEYEQIKPLRQSEKSTVLLVREQGGEQVFVQKLLNGRQDVYRMLQELPHPYLPKLYEVILADGATTVTEEYIEGQSLGSVELSEKQILKVIKELCCVLEFLHGKGIIHRDIKPSNILLAKDGHIRLIDFDAARIPKEHLEQDTRVLGTRGYAAPEQYGFAQTDARTDIYSLGVTLKQLLGDRAGKLYYRRILQKCTHLDPDSRYQSVGQVKRAFFHTKRRGFYGCSIVLLLSAFLWAMRPILMPQPPGAAPAVLPAPENPHWDGDTGIALWGNVPDSGVGGELKYHWRLYRRDTATPPSPDESWYREGSMRGNGGRDKNFPIYSVNLSTEFWTNGFYYFSVAAAGDGVHFTDSPYVLSDVFAYTGESAPPLPIPTGLTWKTFEDNQTTQYYATWENLEDYHSADSFNVRIYDPSGAMIMNNIWPKEKILSVGRGGIQIRSELLPEGGGVYRFTVQAQTSRPNEYQSSPMPAPVPEEYFSPWQPIH